MAVAFKRDPYPGKPKILFIGLAESTHTRSWIDLLSNTEMNVRLFALPSGDPPDDWWVRTYITSGSHRKKLGNRKYLFSGIRGMFDYVVNKLINKRIIQIDDNVNNYFMNSNQSNDFELSSSGRGSLPGHFTPEAKLAQVITRWRPDIIQTLGLFDGQGGWFYYKVRKAYHLENHGKWLIQLRGGSDLTLRKHDPANMGVIRSMLMDCHQIITDNRINIAFATNLGIPERKFAPISPLPGTGGVDLGVLGLSDLIPPSKRERIVLWPKAYESPWSKALPVLESLKIAWQSIFPCEIRLLAVTPEVKSWFLALPQQIRQHCTLLDRITREEVLELMKKTRVLLAPSLVDGIPNILYEAMAYGVFPIVSPLETICTIVEKDENVLFARNLYPEEIASALTRAMSDDKLIDEAAVRNIKIVRRFADRKQIAPLVIDYYHSLI